MLNGSWSEFAVRNMMKREFGVNPILYPQL